MTMARVKSLAMMASLVWLLNGCDGADNGAATAPLYVLKARTVLSKKIKVIDREVGCRQVQVSELWVLGCSRGPQDKPGRSLFAVLPRSAEEFCLMPLNTEAATQRQSLGFGPQFTFCERALNVDLERIGQELDHADAEAARQG